MHYGWEDQRRGHRRREGGGRGRVVPGTAAQAVVRRARRRCGITRRHSSSRAPRDSVVALHRLRRSSWS